MYTINSDLDVVVLLCHDCSHVERIDLFDKSVGSRRTQAARAMQNHSRESHGAGSVLQPIQKGEGSHGATSGEADYVRTAVNAIDTRGWRRLEARRH
jgi:hypothetical protein